MQDFSAVRLLPGFPLGQPRLNRRPTPPNRPPEPYRLRDRPGRDHPPDRPPSQLQSRRQILHRPELSRRFRLHRRLHKKAALFSTRPVPGPQLRLIHPAPATRRLGGPLRPTFPAVPATIIPVPLPSQRAYRRPFGTATNGILSPYSARPLPRSSRSTPSSARESPCSAAG